MQSTSSSDASCERENRLVGDDCPGPDHRRVRDRTAVRPRDARAIPARALRHNAACCVPASRGFGHCPRHWAVSAQRAPAEPFSPRPSLDGPHLRDRRLVRWSSGAGTRDDFASGTADPRRFWVACGALAFRHRKRVPAHQGGRSSVASPMDDSQLRAAIEQAPNVRWVADMSLSADLTYDGAAERVYWGTGGDTAFVVAIVECAEGKPGRVWAFPLRARAMYGTTDLEISLVNPAFGRGFFAENCLEAA